MSWNNDGWERYLFACSFKYSSSVKDGTCGDKYAPSVTSGAWPTMLPLPAIIPAEWVP